MPTQLELYRQWELSASRKVCHVVIIDRGDDSPVNRLTLTDRLYVDKGVDGDRYHQTYPAPIHCIHSNIRFTTTRGRTTFEDLVVSCEGDDLDSLLDETIVGKAVICMKGDESWSILESDFPNRFLLFYVAEVSQVKVEPNGGWRISLRERGYALDNLVSSDVSPLVIGRVDNVPSFLVDDATHRYRFSGYELSTSYRSYRDNGSILTNDDDWDPVLEGGVFKGLVEFHAAPEGQVTGTVWSLDPDYYNLMLTTISDFVRPDYSLYDSEFDLSAHSEPDSGWSHSVCFSADESVMFSADFGPSGGAHCKVREYTISSGEVSTLSYVASYEVGLFLDGIDSSWIYYYIFDIGLSPDGNTLYCLTDTGSVVAVAMDTSLDVTSINAVSTVEKSIAADDSIRAFWISEDGAWIYFVTNDAVVTQHSMSTARDIETISSEPVNTLNLGFLSSVRSIEIKNSGKYLYIGTGYRDLHLFELTTAYSIAEIYNPHRYYYAKKRGSFCFRVSNDLSKFYCVYDAISQFEFEKADGVLPLAIYLDNFGLTPAGITGQMGYLDAFYNTPTSSSEIIADMVGTALAEYTVDHLGTLFATRMKDMDSYTPDSWENVFKAGLGDFEGLRGAHIRHVEFIEPVKKVTVTYDRNFAVQGAGTLALGVTEELRAYYSGEKFYYEAVSEIADSPGAVRRDESFETYFYRSAGAQATAEDYLSVYETRRSLYEWRMSLSWQSLANDVRLGSIIEIDGDLLHKNFSGGDRVVVASRTVDSTMNSQILTVFK